VVQDLAVTAEKRTVELPPPLSGEASPALPAWLAQELEQALAGKLDLPVLPDTAARVLALCQDERSDLRELAQLVQRDQTLAAHVLRVSNSVAYAPKQPIVSLQQALGRLGLSTVSDIAIAVAMKQRVFQVSGHEARMRELWRHSALAAGYALEVAHLVGRNAEMAFLAGLLHDVGMPIVLTTALAACKRQKILPATREELEQAMLTFHCRYGAELARRWGLGPWVEAAITDHHEPARARLLHEDVAIVTLADLLADWAAEGEAVAEPEPDLFALLPLQAHQRQSLIASRTRVLDLASAFQ
jgi:putative nucleotidyltransferase with HDIG domain